ncbi:hypothetical protein BJ878DRAFT_159025 [Calycina marina]|uniref:Uncharacterized protein n=1 Tax=Calycina marina TaxID=1763456 RepID=A0A9P8CDJ0_9HELO|nr:hypothetical protein BJ878DRAFT_159025 [Calycina marina]
MNKLFIIIPLFSTAVDSKSSHRLVIQGSSARARRDVLTCDDTYGPGLVNCGDAVTQMCYNPALGKTCCPLDNGYCRSGQVCAPVAGYCCDENEYLETCATRFDVTISSAISATLTTASTLSLTSPVEAVVTELSSGLSSAFRSAVSSFPFN